MLNEIHFKHGTARNICFRYHLFRGQWDQLICAQTQRTQVGKRNGIQVIPDEMQLT